MSKVFIEETTLSSIGNAIREKAGTSELINPLNMADAITNLPSGGDLPEEAFSVSGDCEQRFSNNGWNWYINEFGNQIETSGITDAADMFRYSSALIAIPFELNFISGVNVSLEYMFYNCSKLEEIPLIKNCVPNKMNHMFSGCEAITSFPEGFEEGLDFSYMESMTSKYNGYMNDLFNNCHSLRVFPNNLIKRGNPNINPSYCVFSNMAQSCYALDEIVDLPNPHYSSAFTETSTYSNAFKNMITWCCRLKRFTFASMDFVPNWKNQLIDFSDGVGYINIPDYIWMITNYSQYTGITEADMVVDDTTYQALKDTDNWFSNDVNYSRYNRISAVETLASLPDCSSIGTNTVKFKGDSGTLTDGGAINTMTEEEIAVATAKGWTVSLV